MRMKILFLKCTRLQAKRCDINEVDEYNSDRNFIVGVKSG